MFSWATTTVHVLKLVAMEVLMLPLATLTQINWILYVLSTMKTAIVLKCVLVLMASHISKSVSNHQMSPSVSITFVLVT